MQNRWGPSRVGPFGLLQPLVDGAKLFLKEDMMPLGGRAPTVHPGAHHCAGLRADLHRPWCRSARSHACNGVDLFQIANVNIGLLVILGVTSIGVYGITLSGWSSNNKYSLLGSLRSTAQVISYELALGLSLVGVVLRAQSLNLRAIVDSQSAHGILSWNIFGGFQIVAFFIYLMAAYAETNRAPFDLPEAENELVAGYHTEYSSMKFAMFFMAEYANMITVSCVATLLFLGGATSAFGHLFDGILNTPVWNAIFPVCWFVAKVFAFLALYIWVRATLPRFRYDQLMGFGWKFLLPLAMANIIVTSFILAVRG